MVRSLAYAFYAYRADCRVFKWYQEGKTIKTFGLTRARYCGAVDHIHSRGVHVVRTAAILRRVRIMRVLAWEQRLKGVVNIRGVKVVISITAQIKYAVFDSRNQPTAKLPRVRMRRKCLRQWDDMMQRVKAKASAIRQVPSSPSIAKSQGDTLTGR